MMRGGGFDGRSTRSSQYGLLRLSKVLRSAATVEALPAIRAETVPRVAGVAEASARPARCAFTIDVEDWYQSSIDYDAPITERVVRNTERVCEILDDSGVKGTFFVQGRVAETFPRLLQDLVERGHEIQSHGYSHRPLYAMDRRSLRTELEWARKSVEDACGVQVTAFRAPDFSILRDNLWALEVLAEVGFEIDSSIFPLKTRRYGIPEWDNAPRRVPLANGGEILEVPVAVWGLGPLRVPVAGGGYFRLLPGAVVEFAVRSILAGDRQPVVIYCHPYEFNPTEMSEYRGSVSPLYRHHQSLGRRSLVRRVRHLLDVLPFGRFDEVVSEWLDRSKPLLSPTPSHRVIV